MAANELKALKSRQTTIKAQCTRMKNAIDSIDPQNFDSIALQQRCDKFKEYWNQYNDVQAAIYELLDKAEGLQNIETLKTEQDEDAANFEENYFAIASKIERLLIGTSQHANSHDQAQVSFEERTRDISQMHLPKIAIPKFSGKYEDWYPFYNTFESIIHSNQRLTSIQKFHYLISSLEGDATHVIQSLEINSDNYQEALQLLKQRYDDKRIIAQEHIKALFDLPTVTKGNHIALRQLIDHVLRHLRSLKGLNRSTAHWDNLIIYIIATRLDLIIIREWEDHIQGEEMPTLNQMIDFLIHKCVIIGYFQKKSQRIFESKFT